MLLITLAPVISQSLGAVRASEVPASYLQTDYCGQPPDTLHQAPLPSPGDGAAGHESCPYCSLLAHLPLLTGGGPAALPARPWLMRRVPAKPSDACPTPPAFSHALSRAPPAVTSLFSSRLERDA
jgi:hypothetical protein